MIFWEALDQLIAEHALVIDRPRGSAHPRYPDSRYPLDYGYLEGTVSGDGQGIDVWVGSRGDRRLDAVLCTVDRLKGDLEVKLLIGCTDEDTQTILDYTGGWMSGLLVRRNVP